MPEKQKERVQFDFSPEALQRLDQLKEKTGAATRAETIRNSLKVYEWIVNGLDADSTIRVVDKNNEIVAMIRASLLLK